MPNAREFRIAVFMDFTVPINRREGITAYVGYLLNALLDKYQNTLIEIWLYSHNKDNFFREYSDIIEKYGNRVSVYDERSISSKEKKEVFHYVAYQFLKYTHHLFDFIHLKRLRDYAGSIAARHYYLHNERKYYNRNLEFAHYFKYQIYKFGYHISSLLGIKRLKDSFGYRAAFHHGMHNQLVYDLPKTFNQVTKSELVFVPFPGLTAALKVNKKVFIQIHDLFTFPLEELFEKESGPGSNFKKSNRRIKKLLEQYASRGATFISSSDYTIDSQVLKYINGVSRENCKVISFPPMIKSFKDYETLDESTFRKKFGITSKYVAFPSQNRPNKNLILLLRALEVLNKEGYNLQLVTTGKMSHCNSTAQFVKGDRRHLVIELSDLNIQELYCLYKYSEMIVCPNIIEGLGISGQCLEGLAIGKPVIHAKSLGIESSLKSVGLNMQTAKLKWVELDDCDGLVEKIKYVLTHKKEVIKEQRCVLEAYSKKTWGDVAKDYMNVFFDLQ